MMSEIKWVVNLDHYLPGQSTQINEQLQDIRMRRNKAVPIPHWWQSWDFYQKWTNLPYLMFLWSKRANYLLLQAMNIKSKADHTKIGLKLPLKERKWKATYPLYLITFWRRTKRGWIKLIHNFIKAVISRWHKEMMRKRNYSFITLCTIHSTSKTC